MLVTLHHSKRRRMTAADLDLLHLGVCSFGDPLKEGGGEKPATEMMSRPVHPSPSRSASRPARITPARLGISWLAASRRLAGAQDSDVTS